LNAIALQASPATASPEAKRTERVALETATHLVKGIVTLPAQGYRARFSDYLNRQDIDFIALTDVEKAPLGGNPVESYPFLVVARKAVVFGYSLDHDAG
jgi:hypothetical protein